MMDRQGWISGAALLSLLALPSAGVSQSEPNAALIAGAVEALPESYRDGAEIRAWTEAGELELVQAGSNEFICLGDRPGNETFQSSCYHVSLEPFMGRGRALRKEGLSGLEYQEARWELVERGELSMPDTPAMVYNFYHDDPNFDPRTDDPESGGRLHAIYMPYMTPETTGLPKEAPNGQPWLMWPGKPSSHIMIFLPAKEGG